MKGRFFRILFTSTACLCLLLCGLKLHHRSTRSFRISKIEFPALPSKGENPPREMKEILSQPFHYLGIGHHCVAFESGDHKYVLKFVRTHKFFPSPWMRISFLSRFGNKVVKEKNRRLAFYLQSHELSQQHLKSETGLLYLHLHKTEDLGNIDITDKLGRVWTISLDDVIFAVQKKFTLYGERLPEFIKAGDDIAVKKLISAYFEVIAARCSKGIVNKDRRGWGKNYATIDDQVAYEIDLGAFQKVQSINSSWEISQCSRDFREWFRQNAPQYLPYFETALQKAIEKEAQQHEKDRLKRISPFPLAG